MPMKNAIQEIGKHTNMMPRESGMTLPMVKIESGSLIVRRLIYYTHLIPKQGTEITPPQYMAIYDLTKQQFITLKKINLELPNLQRQPWIHNRPTFANAEDIIPEFNRIWTLYDILVPAYENQNIALSDEIKKAANEYIILFNRHAEKPLLPFYEHFGGDFLAWVRRISRIER